VSAELLVTALSLLVLAVAAVAIEAAWRPPRCRPCDVPSEALPTELIHTVPAVIEVVYRCPRCERVVSRRRFGDWD
jgi:uncharacterized protein with PIN domain